MDQVKIGKFIAQMRKEQNLTQRGLADKLSISDKTVSKWERSSKGLFFSVSFFMAASSFTRDSLPEKGENHTGRRKMCRAQETHFVIIAFVSLLGK